MDAEALGAGQAGHPARQRAVRRAGRRRPHRRPPRDRRLSPAALRPASGAHHHLRRARGHRRPDRSRRPSSGWHPASYAMVVCRPIPENSVLEIVTAWSARRRGMPLLVVGPYGDDDPYHVPCERRPRTRWSSPGRSSTRTGCSALRFHAPSTCTATPSAARTRRWSRRWRPAMRSSPTTTSTTRGWPGPDNAYFSDADELAPLLDELLDDADAPGADGRRRAGRDSATSSPGTRIGGQYEQALLAALASGHASSTASTRCKEVVAVIDVAVVGLGKMGLSHLSMIRAHPDVEPGRRLRRHRVPAGHPRRSTPGCRPTRTSTRCSTRPSRRR